MCHSDSLHYVGVVSSMPTSVPFVVFMEWPVPWGLLLSPYELHLLRSYLTLCQCPATLEVGSTAVITGYELWALHCHCPQPGSLQCRAGAVLLKRWFLMVVAGSLINLHVPWYRPLVNERLPKEVMYVGSCFARGRHLVYIHVRYDQHAKYLLDRLSFGLAAFNYGVMNNMLILCCTYCKTLEEIRFRCCARRTRRLLLRAVMELDSISRRGLRASASEPRRQRMFHGVVHRRWALRYQIYDQCRSHPP